MLQILKKRKKTIKDSNEKENSIPETAFCHISVFDELPSVL